jgi:transposase
LRRQLEVSESRLKKTEAALDLMGKLQAFLESTSEDMPDEPRSKKRWWPRTGRCWN